MAFRTVIYLRKSSKDREEKQIHSIERQRKDIEEYLEKRAKIEDVLKSDSDNDLFYEDASAKYEGRVEFNRMIQEIKRNKYDVLLCTDLSRLSRNAIDNGILVQLLEKGYLQEVRTLDKIFTTSPTDKFTLSLFLAVSKYENDQRALNTVSGMSNMRAQGATTFKAPMGYINCGEEKGNKWVEQDGENFIKIKRLWALFLSDSWTVKALTEEARNVGVTVLGIKGRRSSPVESTLRSMFLNRYYTGFIKNTDKSGNETWIQGRHDSMVTEEEFQQVQLILQKNGYKHVKMDRAPDLPGIIKAIAVSGIYKIKDDNGKLKPASMIYEKKVRYTCANCSDRYTSNQPKPCPECETPISKDTRTYVDERMSHFTQDHKKKNSIIFALVEKSLKKEFGKLVITEALFNVLRRKLYTMWLEKHKLVSIKRKDLKVHIEKLEEERDELYRKKFLEVKDSEKLMFATERVEKEIVNYEQQLADLKERHEEEFEIAWQKMQVLRDAKELLSPKIDFEPKKRLILSLVSNLVFYKGKIEVEWKEPFARLVKSGVVKNMTCAISGDSLSIKSTGSRGRFRTDDPLVTLVLRFLKGVDYIIIPLGCRALPSHFRGKYSIKDSL
ncbi:MAG: recombinase family protein [Patescibacteria group bacterium]